MIRRNILQPIQSYPSLNDEDKVSFFPVYLAIIYSAFALGYYNIFFSPSKNKLIKFAFTLLGVEAVALITTTFGKNHVFLNSLERSNYFGYWGRKELSKELGEKTRWA